MLITIKRLWTLVRSEHSRTALETGCLAEVKPVGPFQCVLGLQVRFAPGLPLLVGSALFWLTVLYCTALYSNYRTRDGSETSICYLSISPSLEVHRLRPDLNWPWMCQSAFDKCPQPKQQKLVGTIEKNVCSEPPFPQQYNTTRERHSAFTCSSLP